MTITVMPSPLESLIVQDTLLFQELAIDLVVETGQVHFSPKDNSDILLLEVFDGTFRMMGFLLEVSHPLGSVQSRSHLDTLQNHEITGLRIQSARVCLYRQGAGLCPILYISHYQPIQNKDAGALSRKTKAIQDTPLIRDWLSTIENCDEASFLSKVFKDTFWDCYIHHLEPCLKSMVATYKASKYKTMVKTKWSHQNTSPVSSPLQSIDLFPPSPQHTPKLPPSMRKRHALLREYSNLSLYYPTMTWANIQKHIQDTFASSLIDDDDFMDGHLPMVHALWAKAKPESDDTQAPTTTTQRFEDTPSTVQQGPNDWWKLFKTITALPTQQEQENKLKMSKIEMMMDTTDLVLE